MTKKIELNPEAVALLQRVKAHILEEPRRVYMEDWRRLGKAAKETTNPPCGTVACVAGWAVELAHPNPRRVRNFADRALDLLGLKPREFKDEDCPLFYVVLWPKDLKDRLNGQLDYNSWEWIHAPLDAGTPEYAAVVAEAIDRFIANPAEFS